MEIIQNILLIIPGILCIATTALPLLRSEVWWIRIFDFPRLQILVTGVIGFGLANYVSYNDNAFLQYGFLISLGVAILYQGYRIWPYTIFHTPQVKHCKSPKEKSEIVFYISNVLMENRDSKRCLKAINRYNPDVILLVETDQWWLDEVKILKKSHPYNIFAPLENTYGMLLFSKFKLVDEKVLYRVEDEVPSIETKIELQTGEMIKFFGIHPKPPAPKESDSSLPRDAELILVAKQIKTEKLPIVVAGDLNDVAWSDTTHLFQKISGLLDPRVGRGMYSTFNSKYALVRWPLDHLFHSNHFQLTGMECVSNIGSDHFPICVKLSYIPSEKNIQEKPVANSEDKKIAEEKIEKAENLQQ